MKSEPSQKLVQVFRVEHLERFLKIHFSKALSKQNTILRD